MFLVQLDSGIVMITLPYIVQLPEPSVLREFGSGNILKVMFISIHEQAQSKRCQNHNDDLHLQRIVDSCASHISFVKDISKIKVRECFKSVYLTYCNFSNGQCKPISQPTTGNP